MADHGFFQVPAVPFADHCCHHFAHVPQLVYSAGSPQAEVNKAPAGKSSKEESAQKAIACDPNTQFWVKELDGAYTWRTWSDIAKHCLPGSWQLCNNSWHWIREKEGKKEEKKKKEKKKGEEGNKTEQKNDWGKEPAEGRAWPQGWV